MLPVDASQLVSNGTGSELYGSIWSLGKAFWSIRLSPNDLHCIWYMNVLFVCPSCSGDLGTFLPPGPVHHTVSSQVFEADASSATLEAAASTSQLPQLGIVISAGGEDASRNWLGHFPLALAWFLPLSHAKPARSWAFCTPWEGLEIEDVICFRLSDSSGSYREICVDVFYNPIQAIFVPLCEITQWLSNYTNLIKGWM